MVVNKSFVDRHDAGCARKDSRFGGFARVGDVLQVPFIGAYTVSFVDSGVAICSGNEPHHPGRRASR